MVSCRASKSFQRLTRIHCRRSTWLIINSDGFKSTIVSDKRGIIEASPAWSLPYPARHSLLLDGLHHRRSSDWASASHAAAACPQKC